jgi:hypothetical protein
VQDVNTLVAICELDIQQDYCEANVVDQGAQAPATFAAWPESSGCATSFSKRARLRWNNFESSAVTIFTPAHF